MKEKQKIIKYPSGNTKTETYIDGDTSVTRHFYNAKNAYVREFISLKDGVTKIQHYTEKGILSKLDYFVADKRHGQEIKYVISKANRSIKSTKIYDNGKLHGENITYNLNGKIIKHEVYALGKLVLKYLRKNDDNDDITDVEIIDRDNIENLPTNEYDKLQTHL